MGDHPSKAFPATTMASDHHTNYTFHSPEQALRSIYSLTPNYITIISAFLTVKKNEQYNNTLPL
jgi:hypothetical protein